jgi:hypothetical protein
MKNKYGQQKMKVQQMKLITKDFQLQMKLSKKQVKKYQNLIDQMKAGEIGERELYKSIKKVNKLIKNDVKTNKTRVAKLKKAL